jgi:histidinol dehydrogenase
VAQWLRTAAPDFERRFRALLETKRERAEDVSAAVRDIIKDVRSRGDAALIELTRRFDRFEIEQQTIRVSADEIAAGAAACPPEVREALSFAAGRIEAYHRRQLPADERCVDAMGVELGWRWTPIESAGLYVPGGLAAYPSSVLMNAVPARVAGVARLAMVVPTPDGRLNSLVLAAAQIAGVEEIYRVGGAQAIAALAYGTQSIEPVAKIVGPGNAYVAEAKRQVFGIAGIDMIAGPSEVLVLAGSGSDPAWTAADLLAQAEHDPSAQAILITDGEEFAQEVEKAVSAQLGSLPKAAIAGSSWEDFGAIIVVGELREAIPLINRIAPEHLEIAAPAAEELARQVRNAGAIFLGAFTPEAIGDYVGGPNHVLPTARSARFASGLGVLEFMKRTSILKLDSEALSRLGPSAIALGRAEGLEAHARSVAIRLNLR